MSKDLYSKLKDAGLLEYGSHIEGDLVRQMIGIRYPEMATKKVYDDLALQELGAMDYVRSILLNEGKYITSAGGDYRVLLPSENKAQVERYMSSADRKLRRAGKLSRNTPGIKTQQHDNMAVRIMLKRESTRQSVAA